LLNALNPIRVTGVLPFHPPDYLDHLFGVTVRSVFPKTGGIREIFRMAPEAFVSKNEG